MNEFAKNDYWRGVMYTKLQESLARESVSGDGVEFSGGNEIIQNMFPLVKWENRGLPRHDITNPASYERDWDVIVADQVLEHTFKPWEAVRLISEHTKQIAIITIPFLIRIHESPSDYWRMTPKTLYTLSKPYFKDIDVQYWGTIKANHWHALYNKTSTLINNVPAAELEAELNNNERQHPFVVWAILKK